MRDNDREQAVLEVHERSGVALAHRPVTEGESPLNQLVLTDEDRAGAFVGAWARGAHSWSATGLRTASRGEEEAYQAEDRAEFHHGPRLTANPGEYMSADTHVSRRQTRRLAEVKVKSPDGATWRVTRRWVPWRRRLKGAMDLAPDFPALGDDPVSLIVGIVLLIVMIPFLVLFLLGALEMAALLVVYPFALAARVLFGKHWYVEARRRYTVVFDTDGGDWRSSSTKILQLADHIREFGAPESRPPITSWT